MTAKEAAKAEACAKLREWIKPGDTVYTILRNVSRSGMSRDVSVVLIKRDEHGNEYTLHPNWLVGAAIGARVKQGWNDAIVMRGCGTDMGFEIVYNLAYALWPEGFGCVGEGCPSNEHSNGDRDYTPHGFTASGCAGAMANHWHKTPGYALRHKWL